MDELKVNLRFGFHCTTRQYMVLPCGDQCLDIALLQEDRPILSAEPSRLMVGKCDSKVMPQGSSKTCDSFRCSHECAAMIGL